MITKVKAHLLVLPRWFAAPGAICGTLLGVALTGEMPLGTTTMVAIAGLGLMAWAHSMNTLLDYSWTKFDQGTEEARSRPKEYTSGSQVVARGIMSTRENLVNALAWLVLSAILTGIISTIATPWIWFPWTLVALCTFWYSWGKLHYQCELALGLGFGSFAVMFGAASSTAFTPDMLGTAFLAGLPFAIMFGFVLETHDQWTDAERDVPKGLRNLGAMLWKSGASPVAFLSWLVISAYIVQGSLVICGFLPKLSLISLFSILPYSYCLACLEGSRKLGVVLGLAGCFVYMTLMVVGVAI